MGKNAKTFFILLLILLIAGWSNICFAETYSQKDGLFKIDFPQGWQLIEQPGSIMAMKMAPPNMSSIIVAFEPWAVESDEAAKSLLNEEAFWAGIKGTIESRGGTIVNERDIWVDGVYARRLDATITAGNRTMQKTSVSFFHKDHLIHIGFDSTIKEDMAKLESAFETFRLH